MLKKYIFLLQTKISVLTKEINIQKPWYYIDMNAYMQRSGKSTSHIHTKTPKKIHKFEAPLQSHFHDSESPSKWPMWDLTAMTTLITYPL